MPEVRIPSVELNNGSTLPAIGFGTYKLDALGAVELVGAKTNGWQG